MVFDDDIKVYKGEKSCGGERTADEIDRELADELAAQGRDELDEARAVGVELAQMTKEAERGFELEIDDELLLQRRLLLCFAVSTALEDHAVSQQIARVALNTFYDTLKRTDPEFYDDIGSTGSMSFYFLAKRQHGDTVRRIGQTFAMMCGLDGDPVCQELGEALYCRYVNMVSVLMDNHGLSPVTPD